MDATKTVQTAFRFSPDLVRRMKNKARSHNKSVNSYVEDLIMMDLNSDKDKYESLFKEMRGIVLSKEVPEDIMSLSRCKFDVVEEDLQADPKLAYILTK